MEKQVAPNSYLLRTRSSLPQPQPRSGVTIWTDCNIMSSQQHLRLGLVSGVACVRSSIMLQRVWFTNSSLIYHLLHIRIEATMFRFRKSQKTKLEGVTKTMPTLLVRASSVSGSLLLVLPPFLDSYSEVLRATNALFAELQDHGWEWRIEDVEQWQLLQWQWCFFWWRWKMKGLKQKVEGDGRFGMRNFRKNEESCCRSEAPVMWILLFLFVMWFCSGVFLVSSFSTSLYSIAMSWKKKLQNVVSIVQCVEEDWRLNKKWRLRVEEVAERRRDWEG